MFRLPTPRLFSGLKSALRPAMPRFKAPAFRRLATAAWGIIALVWLTVRVMKRLQQLEKQQKQQREEAIDPLSVELNA
ncbi:type VI secretion system membrane subunit TssM, partial [Escherichia marmotae]|nr:type VI secretion system membrane subunit TssM [Escherichia marmotae]